MATIYARLINHYKCKNDILFSASFYKINEEEQRSDETELFIYLNIHRNLTENDNNDIDVKVQLEHQIQIQETKDSGWIFDKTNSMKIRLYRTGELIGSSYVKILFKSNAILNRENNGKNCFAWSKLAHLHLCKNDHPKRLSNYREYFDELSSEGFDFSNGFRCSVVHIFKKLNNLSINIFELN